ncbi:hypothetical protein P7K49_007891 [Saguinus oedipus]|uniref:Uncharacterized protein n=1 Tax=Saguinus oedipus TaxID=9490 RepID=A0ABQ9VWX0_SAGOE|nr:hypothetical protein P7K49_007891 [Saguinus oedipus]
MAPCWLGLMPLLQGPRRWGELKSAAVFLLEILGGLYTALAGWFLRLFLKGLKSDPCLQAPASPPRPQRESWPPLLVQEHGEGPIISHVGAGSGPSEQGPLFCRTIKVEVYDWDRDGSLLFCASWGQSPDATGSHHEVARSRMLRAVNIHDFIGEFTTSYRELARGQSQFNIYEKLPRWEAEALSSHIGRPSGGKELGSGSPRRRPVWGRKALLESELPEEGRGFSWLRPMPRALALLSCHTPMSSCLLAPPGAQPSKAECIGSTSLSSPLLLTARLHLEYSHHGAQGTSGPPARFTWVPPLELPPVFSWVRAVGLRSLHVAVPLQEVVSNCTLASPQNLGRHFSVLLGSSVAISCGKPEKENEEKEICEFWHSE